MVGRPKGLTDGNAATRGLRAVRNTETLAGQTKGDGMEPRGRREDGDGDRQKFYCVRVPESQTELAGRTWCQLEYREDANPLVSGCFFSERRRRSGPTRLSEGGGGMKYYSPDGQQHSRTSSVLQSHHPFHRVLHSHLTQRWSSYDHRFIHSFSLHNPPSCFAYFI